MPYYVLDLSMLEPCLICQPGRHVLRPASLALQAAGLSQVGTVRAKGFANQGGPSRPQQLQAMNFSCEVHRVGYTCLSSQHCTTDSAANVLVVTAAAACPFQQLGGNVSLALLLTVTTNILGIVTMPFILPHIAKAAALSAPTAAAAGASAACQSAAAHVVLEPVPLMLQLCQTILVPTMLGASVRGLIPGAADVIDKHKKLLSCINAGLLASVPWMQVGHMVPAGLGSPNPKPP